jgi:hypothetical protein
VWQYIIKLNTHLPYASATSHLSIYPKETETYPQKALYTNIYNSKNWKLKFKYPPTHEWITKKLKGYVAITRNSTNGHSMEEPQKYYARQRKSNSKTYVYMMLCEILKTVYL